MAANTPCGLSFNRTLEIIKDNVLKGNYNGRSEVMAGLLRDGFTYPEARQVTDKYFQIYSRVSNSAKSLKPNIILSPKEKLAKRLNNIAVDYLNGNIQGFPMTDADTKALEAIYEKHAKADTPTLKEKYNEEASVFVQKFLPNYSNELFKSSVYARPLLSAVFFIKSLTSNLYAQVERSITDTIWDGKRADFTWLKKFGELANQSFINVLKGGVPATSLYQSEANVGTSKGRLEEFSIKNTEAASNPLKSAYYGAMKFMTKWSNRLNAAPDTRGIFSNAERHFYQLLKEKYRGLGLSSDEAKQKALEAMELDDKDTATKMAESKFKELGLPITGNNGKNTTEFNVAVAEYQRRHRNEDIWGRALMLSKNDFWKRNMTVASELGFGDYGLFGLKAQALSGLRDKVEKHKKTKALSAFNLYAFGFLNGASNFAEDALERVPLYAAVKIAFLQARKGNVTDTELQGDISRRQRDIIVKNFTTAMFFITAKYLEKLICPDYAGKQGTSEVSEGRTQIGICGIPLFVPPQMLATYKMYKIIDEATDNDEEFLATALNIVPVLVQSNQIGLGGGLDKLGTNSTNWGLAQAQGNKVRADEEKDKLVKQVVRMGADVGNSFLPIPSRALNEAAAVMQRIRGINQKQQDLPFAIDEFGNKKGMLNTLGKVTIASIGNVTGISEAAIAAMGAKKEYAVDWQGRKVMLFRGSDITGSGIQYTKADDILATAGVKTPYVNRLEKVSVGKEKEKVKGFSGKSISKETKKVRYMTDEEYFNVSVALGKFNKEYFEKNGDNIIKLVEGDKATARKEFKRVFDNTKKKAVEAVGEGKDTIEEILSYVKKNWEGKTGRKISSTELNN
ncbi:MAG TPA: hypothetical protein DIC42_03355 [Holosporales bacterium]|nr:hypothetical protein [Holosporales bacterium]